MFENKHFLFFFFFIFIWIIHGIYFQDTTFTGLLIIHDIYFTSPLIKVSFCRSGSCLDESFDSQVASEMDALDDVTDSELTLSSPSSPNTSMHTTLANRGGSGAGEVIYYLFPFIWVVILNMVH